MLIAVHEGALNNSPSFLRSVGFEEFYDLGVTIPKPALMQSCRHYP